MTTIIIGIILLIAISLILVGLRMSMNQVELNRKNQEVLNRRILDSLPNNFRMDTK